MSVDYDACSMLGRKVNKLKLSVERIVDQDGLDDGITIEGVYFDVICSNYWSGPDADNTYVGFVLNNSNISEYSKLKEKFERVFGVEGQFLSITTIS